MSPGHFQYNKNTIGNFHFIKNKVKGWDSGYMDAVVENMKSPEEREKNARIGFRLFWIAIAFFITGILLLIFFG
jgi:hypothetical protein